MATETEDIALLRLAMITFTPAPRGWRTWRNIVIDEIEVKHVRDWEVGGALKVLVATTQLLHHRPKVTSENLVVVPERERQAAEEAIEIAANLVAITQGCRRAIESPIPYVGFVAQSDAAKRWLQERAGLLHRPIQGGLRLVPRINLDKHALSALADRTDGVALLVEALAQEHAIGKFRDFVRLFERAFALPPRKLTSPLTSFLYSQFGYTRDEIAVWLEQYRDAVTHADTRTKFLLETDVRPVIDRMEQAATDVLFNKLAWRDGGWKRRQLWTPPRGTTNRAGRIFVTLTDQDASLRAEPLDEYGAFSLTGKIPGSFENWWPTHFGAPRDLEVVADIIDPTDLASPRDRPNDNGVA